MAGELAPEDGSAGRDVHAETRLVTHERDLVATAERMAAWLVGALGVNGPVSVSDVRAPSGGGLSSVTVLFRATWEQGGFEQSRVLVARLAPEATSFPVFPSYDLRLQYDVMAGVAARTEVPVPPLVAIEETGNVLGTPFLLMAEVAGQAPTDNPPYVFGGWLAEVTPEERRRLQDATLGLIAELHSIPDPGALFSPRAGGAPVSGADALRSHVDQQRAYYAWTHERDGLRVPLLERTFDWLEANWPAQPGPAVLSWGDARPGNVLYRDLEPVAALDWEMAALGPRELDLGWYLFIHRFFQDIAEVFELPGLPDFARREDVVGTYQRFTGHRVRDLDWYIVYAALRHGIVMSQIKRRMIHFGEEQGPEHPDDYVMHRLALEQLIGDPPR